MANNGTGKEADRTRREFLTLLGSSATVAGVHSLGRAQMRNRANVVLIMADDLGYECLGCYGSTSYSTPHLDGLAASGARFEHCYSQPLCTPSRVQLMTGKYNFRNYTGFGVLSPKENTFGHLFQRSGYATCVVGKWQLWGYNNARGKRGQGVYPDKAGFDEYCLWQIEDRQERYADPYLYVNSRTPESFPGQYGPDVCCDYLCDFIERKKDEPFFAYYPMILTHDPFVPTPRSPEWLTGQRGQKDDRFFGDMVSYMDEIVGRIAAHLEKLGLHRNTLLLFLSDNGTHRRITSQLGEQSIQGGKGRPTDAGTRVPLIANWPGTIPASQISSDLVDTTDFLPTIADAAGIQLPDDFHADGRSFMPQLRGETGNPRDWVFCHYYPDWGSFSGAVFVRDHRWKLYENGDLFDIPADPLEKNPIPQESGSDEAEAARTRFLKVLDKMH